MGNKTIVHLGWLLTASLCSTACEQASESPSPLDLQAAKLVLGTPDTLTVDPFAKSQFSSQTYIDGEVVYENGVPVGQRFAIDFQGHSAWLPDGVVRLTGVTELDVEYRQDASGA